MSSPKRRRVQVEEVWIVGAARTPIGSISGSLAKLSASDLAGIAITKAVERSNVPKDHVQVIFKSWGLLVLSLCSVAMDVCLTLHVHRS